jgi:cyclin H
MDYKSLNNISSWNFTSTQLEEIRKRGNCRARNLLLKDFEKKKEQKGREVHNDSSTASQSSAVQLPVSFAKGYGCKTKEIDAILHEKYAEIKESEDLPFLSATEETTLVQFYATKMFDLIGPNALHPPLRRDIKVPSTAALLLRRFYLSNSVMFYDPKVFMVACAFLATKIEDVTVKIRHLEEGTKLMKAHVTIPEIIKSEIIVAAGCDYDFICVHSYRAVESYTEDLRTFLKTPDGRPCVNRDWVGSADLRPLYEEARQIVEEVSVTDVPLISTSGKIGLASLFLANETLIKKRNDVISSNIESKIDSGEVDDGKDSININFKRYLQVRFASDKNQDKGANVDTVWRDIEQLCASMRELRKNQVDIASLKLIHKKLKKCRGSEKKKKKKRKRED